MPQGTIATLEESQATGNVSGLEAAVQRLKARLSAGLPMEQAMVSAGEGIDSEYRCAVELWFGMEY